MEEGSLLCLAHDVLLGYIEEASPGLPGHASANDAGVHVLTTGSYYKVPFWTGRAVEDDRAGRACCQCCLGLDFILAPSLCRAAL